MRRRSTSPAARASSPLPSPATPSGSPSTRPCKCRETGEEKTIVFGLTGTGYFDMVAYEKFNNGEMSDYIPTDAELQKGFDSLPKVPQNEGI